jgi:ubiquinone/menaquinone biosynthesis C-methylase UbiE
MLDAAGLQSGQRVLDLAAGTGDQTLLAARRVLPGGSVLAVDISASMLEIAAELASEAGLSNVETMVSDGSTLELPAESFDAAICRLGLMFIADLAWAVKTVRTALKRNARFAALVWSAPETNPSMGIVIDVLREQRRLPSPPPTIVQAFSLSKPGALERALVGARFRNVHVEAVSVERRSASMDEAMAALTTTVEILGELPQEERAPLEAEIRKRYGVYVRADGAVVLPGEAWLGSGEC